MNKEIEKANHLISELFNIFDAYKNCNPKERKVIEQLIEKKKHTHNHKVSMDYKIKTLRDNKKKT